MSPEFLRTLVPLLLFHPIRPNVLEVLCLYSKVAVLLAARSKAWDCGRSPAETVGSNPNGDMVLMFV
jgi:hypothetical protein